MPPPRLALVLALTAATLIVGASGPVAAPAGASTGAVEVLESSSAGSGQGADDDMVGMDMPDGQMPADEHEVHGAPAPRPVAPVLAAFVAVNAGVLLVAARWRRRERRRPRPRPRRTPATA